MMKVQPGTQTMPGIKQWRNYILATASVISPVVISTRTMEYQLYPNIIEIPFVGKSFYVGTTAKLIVFIL